jgi:predicted CopG family antitoxin
MKNSIKKNETSVSDLIKLINAEWKKERGLFNIIRYIQKDKTSEMKQFFELVKIDRKTLTPELLLEKMTIREKNRVNKLGEVIEPKSQYTIYTILRALARNDQK